MEVVAYRGEHGPIGQGLIQTMRGSVTFTDSLDVAATYATIPNDRFLSVVDPRVVEAKLTIRCPLIDAPDDPFIDLKMIACEMGREVAVRMALKHANWIEQTSLWRENFAGRFGCVFDLLSIQPESIKELYLQAWPLLDDAEFVQIARKAGFDGAIHAGSGESLDAVEYRVFDRDGILVLRVWHGDEIQSIDSDRSARQRVFC